MAGDGSTWAAALSIPGVEQLEPIGRGGFATVYRGWQPEFHRPVAVKVLDPGPPSALDRFRREVRAMGSVSDHPNIVPVYDAGIVDERGYLVMPFLAGGSLEDRLRQGPLPADEVVRIGRALAGALSAAHQTGLLHRDVKPANVLFTVTNEPKLGDFGVARFTDATATQGELTATVSYAAPEVLEGRPATAASDVYSLGATLHGALTGSPPFPPREGEPPVATALRVVHDRPTDLRAAGVPSGVVAVLEQAMAKDPSARLPTADALRAALEGALLHSDPDVTEPIAVGAGDETVAMTPATATVPLPSGPPPAPAPAPVAAPPPTSRNRWLPWVAAAVLALIVLGAGALALSRAGDEDLGTTASTTAAPNQTTARASVPATTATTRRATTTAPSTTAAEPTTTTPPANPQGSPTAAARSYYALMDAGRIDEGWDRLSPRYQQRTGRSSYESFWRSIDSVQVLEASEQGRAALVTLRYTRTDGSVSEERGRLDFVPAPDSDQLLIDDYRVG